MGLSATAVLICSNIVISLLRKVIPDKVRIPCYIVVIAGFVTLVQFVLQAYVPSLYQSLGLFLPLIVVNCIILGRAEAFANKNNIIDSALDGVGMGLGFTLTLGLIAMLNLATKGKALKKQSFSCGGCPMYNSCNLAEVKDEVAAAAPVQKGAEA